MSLATLIRLARRLGWLSDDTEFDDPSQYDQNGWQYGLRYSDGYVSTRWKGPNQKRQIMEYRVKLADQYNPEYVLSTTIVRRSNTSGPWLDARIRQIF